jgi:hypothetical protein
MEKEVSICIVFPGTFDAYYQKYFLDMVCKRVNIALPERTPHYSILCSTPAAGRRLWQALIEKLVDKCGAHIRTVTPNAEEIAQAMEVINSKGRIKVLVVPKMFTIIPMVIFNPLIPNHRSGFTVLSKGTSGDTIADPSEIPPTFLIEWAAAYRDLCKDGTPVTFASVRTEIMAEVSIQS